MYYYIEPEVAGGLGDSTVLDSTVHPPKVSLLEYQFDGWLGDELLESFPCFIVTEALSKALKEFGLNGFDLGSVRVTKSDQFEDIDGFLVLPSFVWLKVHGEAGLSDFGLAKDNRLVVSAAARNVIEAFRLNNADFEGFH